LLVLNVYAVKTLCLLITLFGICYYWFLLTLFFLFFGLINCCFLSDGHGLIFTKLTIWTVTFLFQHYFDPIFWLFCAGCPIFVASFLFLFFRLKILNNTKSTFFIHNKWHSCCDQLCKIVIYC
jgi:hypothetical protein